MTTSEDSSNAEKAWKKWVKAHPQIEDDEHSTFLAGRASRDAEVEALVAEAARAWEMGWLAGHQDCWDHECGQGHGRIVNPYSGSEACEGSAGA